MEKGGSLRVAVLPSNRGAPPDRTGFELGRSDGLELGSRLGPPVGLELGLPLLGNDGCLGLREYLEVHHQTGRSGGVRGRHGAYIPGLFGRARAWVPSVNPKKVLSQINSSRELLTRSASQ